MRIGYPCINRTLSCRGNRTFRLASYSPERLFEVVNNNLECLLAMLSFNLEHNILAFRITSDLVPFASHPVCQADWASHFSGMLKEIGTFAIRHGMRLSMHPDQFTLINSPRVPVLERSLAELAYHCRIMDAMELDRSAKIQIHVGGVYGDRRLALNRFISRFQDLSPEIRSRLVIENDDRLYGLDHCLKLHDKTGIPVVFDQLHHRLLNNGETSLEALRAAACTWTADDGLPLVDYSSQQPHGRRGAHAHSLDIADFKTFLVETRPVDFDVMLEIKEKERAAIQAIRLAERDPRLNHPR